MARGPKARAALRAAGLTEAWSPESESCAEVLDHLSSTGADPKRDANKATKQSRRAPLTGRRIAVQLHGEPQEEFCGALAAAGAEVVEVPVYRWAVPLDPTPLQRLVDLITNRMVDAVTFTSAPAVASLLRAAGPDTETVLDALRADVLAGCVGPLTAEPLRPSRRTGAGPGAGAPRCAGPGGGRGAAAADPDAAGGRRASWCCAGTRRSSTVCSSRCRRPRWRSCARWPRRPGRVLPRSELLEALPRGADEHAVEMAVARLRAALGASSFIQTVVKRGYRLRVD